MEIWLFILLFLSICLLLRRRSAASLPLPPGIGAIPFIGTLRWVRNGLGGLEGHLRDLHRRLGPIVPVHFTTRPAIFVADRSLAHQALIQNGAVFADRPPAPPTSKVITSNQHNISSASYGPTWRLLRRNLTSEILHPSRVRSYSHARRWVLQILADRFRTSGGEKPVVVVVDHLHYAMFALLVLMCFGDKLDEKQIKQVEFVQRRQLLSIRRFNILNLWPKLTKFIFWKKWEEFLQLRREQEAVLLPLICARRKIVDEKTKSGLSHKDYVLSYVDTLLDLELPDEKRKLNENEMISLCSEFLNAGTDTTATALQWIMANLVKYPEIQNRLYEEIKGVVSRNRGESGEEGEISEEDVQKMPYLKAVVLEGLRRHPPGHTVLPHSVTDETVLAGYSVPKNCTINFMVAEMGWDPQVWDDPMAFNPERFINGEEAVDITGSRGIKMMPFGAGRRICPGLGLALMHLEYFVANLVSEFEWKAAEDDDVDLSEKQEFTIVMKQPLKAHAVPRRSHCRKAHM
ncbi:PREDICTED: cytochrome P450 89A2-like [Tarenaya hassleriana]|uniref:cytochrome P450 89A2-like n=1 Tax=Tarenaya hassleriana TaxID=28532 RepID=UPI00053C3430|nr:PREDICTED: cytochrome P450 89A2-like [Tarenaya hassleriana]